MLKENNDNNIENYINDSSIIHENLKKITEPIVRKYGDIEMLNCNSHIVQLIIKHSVKNTHEIEDFINILIKITKELHKIKYI